MWWIQTTGYHVDGLIWLIVIAGIFVIAVVGLGLAGVAAGSARRARRMVRDHETYHLKSGSVRMNEVGERQTAMATPQHSAAPPPPPAAPPQAWVPERQKPEERTPSMVEDQSQSVGTGLGDSMRILHERYARGEITRDEYLRAREDMMAMTR